MAFHLRRRDRVQIHHITPASDPVLGPGAAGPTFGESVILVKKDKSNTT